MDETLKNNLTKLLIAFLALIAGAAYLYIYLDNRSKTNDILVVEKRAMSAKVLELKSPPPNARIKIEDTKTNEIFDDVFISEVCPLYSKNEAGRVMDINKLVILKVQDNTQETKFDGIYDYICTDKKDKEEKTNTSEQPKETPP